MKKGKEKIGSAMGHQGGREAEKTPIETITASEGRESVFSSTKCSFSLF